MTNDQQKAALNVLKGLDIKKIQKRKKDYEESVTRIVKVDPWVEIELIDGETYKLEYTFAACKEVFRETGKNIHANEVTLEVLGDMANLVPILLAGLHCHHKDMTIEDLEGLLTMRHRMYYVTRISQALEAIQPDLDQLESLAGDVQSLVSQLEDTQTEDTGPLPEIVPSPISGLSAE